MEDVAQQSMQAVRKSSCCNAVSDKRSHVRNCLELVSPSRHICSGSEASQPTLRVPPSSYLLHPARTSRTSDLCTRCWMALTQPLRMTDACAA